MNKLQNITQSRFNQALVGVGTVVGVILGAVGVAGATTYDPTADLTTLAGNAVSTMGPVIVALAGAVVGIAILSWGLRAVFRMISSGGKHV
jgi:hypothetical protein